MKVSRPNRAGQRGDTIVEVLISVAVASLVLAGAYAISNRNVSATQDVQEHSQALQLAQQQVESLRALAQATGWAGMGGNACITGAPPTLTPAGPCNSIKADGSTGCTIQPCYRVSITSPAASTYEVKVQWDSIISGTSQLTLDYGI